MFKLLKNAEVYTPDYLGKKDILLCFDRIACIGEHIDSSMFHTVELVDCSEKIVFPGFIDLHVHITGGGGEGGYTTRTAEIKATELLKSGITTVVGVLGTDGITRSMQNLYAKAKQLELEGLTTYIYTGSYQVPVVTLTGSIQQDMVFVEKVIGVGEICLSDSRDSQPTFQEIKRVAAQVRNGALISGKAGILHFHIGEGEDGMEFPFRLINETLIPKAHFLPTHVNRTKVLFGHALKYLEQGGYIDLTAGFIPSENTPDCIATYEAIRQMIDSEADLSRVTMSSDANGSAPIFDDQGNVISSDTVSCKILFEEIRKGILEYKVPIEKAISLITRNPAQRLGIDRTKGTLEPGKDADFVICDQNLNIVNVIAKGKSINS